MPRKTPRQSKKISRRQALRIAQAHICQEALGKSPRVLDGADAKVRAYNVQTADTWIIYRHNPELSIRSSDVVVISKRTGRVIYDGSAHDEG